MDELFTCPNCGGERRYLCLVSAPNGHDHSDHAVCDNCKTVLQFGGGRIFNSPFEPDLDAASQAEADKLADYTAASA